MKINVFGGGDERAYILILSKSSLSSFPIPTY
jgi:hypothetical protein